MRIVEIYMERCAGKEQCINGRRSKHATCTILRELTEAARISSDSAAKAIKFFHQGEVDVIPQGNGGLRGFGSMKGKTALVIFGSRLRVWRAVFASSRARRHNAGSVRSLNTIRVIIGAHWFVGWWYKRGHRDGNGV